LHNNSQKQLAKGVSQQHIVDIKVPSHVPAEACSFKLHIFDRSNHENNLASSQVIHVTIPEAIEEPALVAKKSVSMLAMCLVLGGLVLAAGAGTMMMADGGQSDVAVVNEEAVEKVINTPRVSENTKANPVNVETSNAALTQKTAPVQNAEPDVAYHTASARQDKAIPEPQKIYEAEAVPESLVEVKAPVSDVFSQICESAFQGKVAWDRQGRTTWLAANLEVMCQGAEDSTEPATCFQTVMQNSQWGWNNAMKLCKGTTDSARTLQCHDQQLSAGYETPEIIKRCMAY